MKIIQSATKFLFPLFLLACSAHHTNKNELFTITLKTINGVEFPLQQLSTNKASVFIFLSPDCPVCQSYSLTLNQLFDKYKTDGVKFYGVFPGSNFDRSEIETYIKTYNLKPDLLMDEEKHLSTLLGAKVTPEVFVIDRMGNILYKGSIDNWMYEPGQKRTLITEHYLDDALNALISNTAIKTISTEAKGCLIE
ncbi:MAG: redoxin domain-containing protein [Bacteroidetes bacterium]|nr:redoxin domain-containing protein [Bacteroidota bacterium]